MSLDREAADSTITDTKLREYEQQRRLYEDFESPLKDLIIRLLKSADLRVHTVTARTKSMPSIRAKLSKRGPGTDAVPALTDLLGVRIITFFSDDVDRIGTLIEREFSIDRENSIDKRKLLDPDRFGYLSLHYVCRLSDDRRRLSEYQSFKECVSEIQVRTILQHAWAEIEHDLGYKAAITIPAVARRRFSRLASLLELADSEFLDIRNSLATYQRELKTEIFEAPQAVALDALSLRTFCETDPTSVALETRMADYLGIALTYEGYSNEFYGRIVERLREAGIRTIDQLRAGLQKHGAFLFDQWRERVDKMTSRPPGLKIATNAVNQLYQFLVARDGGMEALRESFLRHKIEADRMEVIYEALSKGFARTQ